MLRYIYGNDLHDYPKLAQSMFQDWADQFKTRLGWDVSVNAQGHERDDYDDLNPLYVIWEESSGRHGGSMRFLPTTGPVMVNDHFSHLLGGGTLVSPLIWECTRFCLAQGAAPRVAAALMLGGGEIMAGFGVRHFVGVFDARMVRIYRMIGSSPEILGTDGEGRSKISVGLWEFAPDAKARIAARTGLSEDVSRLWFDRAFGRRERGKLALSA
ncbi:hypothetical protein SuNHUV7_18720 (plasmid) [Pseudoseohaeicola sp. NH-UV-7]|uniref:acyl-homoserine-lactone synthase n=1 Tax=Sulfitobacter sp. TBRI5 TaxID=2989732 RepID=UPI003A796112